MSTILKSASKRGNLRVGGVRSDLFCKVYIGRPGGGGQISAEFCGRPLGMAPNLYKPFVSFGAWFIRIKRRSWVG